VGFAKGAAAYASLLQCPVVIGNKQRVDHSETVEVVEVIGDVKKKNVLLADDCTITGHSLIEMARVLKQRGARDVYAAVTHGVLSKGAGPRIADSDIKTLFVTDTIESSFDPLPPNVEVVTVAPLFAAAIRSIHDRTSVSMLFPETRAKAP
jgi:ribose-phosphate pyrophosphokinase